jgi:hypothetical protein
MGDSVPLDAVDFEKEAPKKCKVKSEKKKSNMKESDKTGGGDKGLMGAMADGLCKLKLKVAIFLLIIFTIIMSESFKDHVLDRLDNTLTPNGMPTTKGVAVQAVVLILSYLFIDILTENSVI